VLAPNVNTKNFYQRTLASEIDCVGIGIHSGAKVSMTLKPAEIDTGIVFIRTDLEGDNAIKTHWENVTDTRLCTLISNQSGAFVGTIEHLVAAFRGCDIHNVIVEIDGPEVPVMDGSSAPFVFLIECAGMKKQDALLKFIKIKQKVSVTDGLKFASLSPGQYTSYEFAIDFDASVIGHQECFVNLHEGAFKNDIAMSRTFGFVSEFDTLRNMGLARGASLDNAIAISDNQVLNAGGLRSSDEFVKHKLLDSIGDTYLTGHPIIGHFKGIRSGHALNHKLLCELFAQADAWEYVTFPELAASMDQESKEVLKQVAMA